MLLDFVAGNENPDVTYFLCLLRLVSTHDVEGPRSRNTGRSFLGVSFVVWFVTLDLRRRIRFVPRLRSLGPHPL